MSATKTRTSQGQRDAAGVFSDILQFNVTRDRNDTGIPGGEPLTKTPTYAKPMQVTAATPITSEILLEIKDEYDRETRFFCEFIIKQVPTAIWGAYSTDSDPSNGKAVASLLNSKDATVAQNMGIQFVAPESTESPDAIRFSVDLASAYSVFPPTEEPIIPGPEDVPPNAIDPAHFGDVINKMCPIISAVPYSTRNIAGRMTRPLSASADLITSWIAYSGTTTESTFGAALVQLSANTTTAPAWTTELYIKPTEPLPILSAQATVKALLNDGTKFAAWDPTGSSPSLSRAFYDGGKIGYPWN
ncbi:MAG: hypothetical protein M1833_006084 [Piccolia ochrophora]|nr:MAG: hypothetical protein M1833_006084 [Piccolia ochrophora]